MNYRHLYHAGNFADVMKHALLIELVRAMQRKEKGFLYLDTHAGRGSYDLGLAAQGDSLARRPESPDGVGRVLGDDTAKGSMADGQPSAALGAYAELVRRFDRNRGNLGATPRFYPGSPAIVRALARAQDRLALCEQLPDEYAALAAEFVFHPRASVHEMDGYIAVRAMLPPAERRALVLIDPPYESQEEFARVATALRDGLARLAGGVFCVWYPLTQRARVDSFFAALRALPLPPTLVLELSIAGEASALKLRGCGLVVLNPPWQLEQAVQPLLEELAQTLAQEPGARSRTEWLVPEA